LSWQDRVREYCELISPTGQNFIPKWVGDTVSIEKKVNRQQLYGIDGELADDLGLKSRDYPLTLYFDGPENDKETLRFERALAERGVWNVTHPLDGALQLQPLTSSRDVQPVESGNVTVLTTEWMEPLADTVAMSRPDASAAISKNIAALNAASVADMSQADVSTVSGVKAVGAKVKQSMQAVTKTVKAANDRVNAIERQINEIANSAQMSVAELSGAVIQLIQAPGLIAGNVKARIDAFQKLGAQIIADLSGSSSASASSASLLTRPGMAQINVARISELFLNALAGAQALALISGDAAGSSAAASGSAASTSGSSQSGGGSGGASGSIQTRIQVLSILAKYQATARASQAALENVAKSTAGGPFDEQYFPRKHAAEIVASLNASVTRYLMDSLYDLRVERTVTLEKPEAPLAIAIREYNSSAGNADADYAYFLATNDLHGNEILILSAGREVKIYA
jgi:prophage DNA circulation protein